MKIGDLVRVKESVIVYHHPEQKMQPLDIKGMEGEITKVMIDWQGRAISPNLPILVKFEQKFKAHFQDNELEII
ncbi:Ferredoxin-thioredoxin reductase, variable chain [Hyella patelloides LEGE 07179]|uniref:Ferredoxin-thioredoxin reductase, variable chain n=1 Tax=Hyella patelloides LEGE 07179 TaxID=945734 RepID=A0A563VRP2_9CYAN|nr:Ferredoxin-thioredoxin reductase, variable chain [Hyella patelloides LEGE 07179]